MTAQDKQALLSRVPDTLPDGPKWLLGIRQSAAESLRATGLPHQKIEAWRFTPVGPVTSVPFAPAAPVEDASESVAWATERAGDDHAYQVVLVNGRPRQVEVIPGPIEVKRLAQVLKSDPGAVEPHLGRVARSEYFGALNAALFEDGLFVHVRRGFHQQTPVHVIHVAEPGAEPQAAYPRVLVVAEEGSEVQLVETFLGREGGKTLTNVVTEIVLGAGARVDHTRIHQGAPNGFHVGHVAVRQGRDSWYASRVVALGGAFYRTDIDVELAGPGAECVLDGVYHVMGNDVVDHHTRIVHASPHCTSHESYRGILDESGRAVFDGTIVVAPDAQKTSAHQENRNLLLSDNASINTKPHLEIDADDVRCSHGATIGALDEEQLYYLRARGIGAEQAEAILTYAFVRQVLDRIPHDSFRRRLGAVIKSRLPHGDSIQELS